MKLKVFQQFHCSSDLRHFGVVVMLLILSLVDVSSSYCQVVIIDNQTRGWNSGSPGTPLTNMERTRATQSGLMLINGAHFFRFFAF